MPKVSRATRAAMMLELSPLRDGGEGVGLLDAGLLEDLLVEAEAGDGPPVEPAGRRRNASGSLSMTATVWLRSSRLRGERRADPAAAHDHDVHGADTPATPRRCPASRRPLDRPSLSARGCLATCPSGSCSAASCAATSWARRCCPSGSRCRSSPATRCRRWPTRRDEIFIMLSLAGAGVRAWSWKIGIAVAVVMLDRGRVVPAERARLPERRRRLRGRHGQPRPTAGADRGQRAARRLRAHRRGVDLVRRRRTPRRRRRSSSRPRGRGAPSSLVVVADAR